MHALFSLICLVCEIQLRTKQGRVGLLSSNLNLPLCDLEQMASFLFIEIEIEDKISPVESSL